MAFTNGRRRASASSLISCTPSRARRSPSPGLWETWTGPNGEELDTATIVTTEANRTLSAIHDRMPVIVPPEAFDLWLDCANVDATTAAALIAPAPDDLLEAYRVSTAVNRTANDNPKLMEPVVPGAAGAGAGESRAPKPRARQAREARKTTGRGRCFSAATAPCPD